MKTKQEEIKGKIKNKIKVNNNKTRRNKNEASENKEQNKSK